MMVPCTLVSILPYALREEKPLHPGSFNIPAVGKGDLEVLVVRETTREFYVDYQRGFIQIPEDPEVVARSVVADHIRATIHSDTNTYPGLFYVVGDKTKEQVQKEHKAELARVTAIQNSWLEKLIKVADDNWQRYRRHNVISDQYRLAARWLGVKREWSDIVNPVEMGECQYCTTLISSKAIICPQCRMLQEGPLSKLTPQVQETIRGALLNVKDRV